MECPVQACGALIWKYNLIPHLLDTPKGVHPVPGGARCQAWRQRGKGLLLKLHGPSNKRRRRSGQMRQRRPAEQIIRKVMTRMRFSRGRRTKEAWSRSWNRRSEEKTASRAL